MQSLPDVPLRLIVLATLAVSAGIVLILLVASLFTGSSGGNERTPVAPEPPRTPLERVIGPLQLYHFYIPNPEREVLELSITPFRDPGRPWSEDEIELFWLDPLKIGLEEVEKQNRTLIEELYATIP